MEGDNVGDMDIEEGSGETEENGGGVSGDEATGLEGVATLGDEEEVSGAFEGGKTEDVGDRSKSVAGVGCGANVSAMGLGVGEVNGEKGNL